MISRGNRSAVDVRLKKPLKTLLATFDSSSWFSSLIKQRTGNISSLVFLLLSFLLFGYHTPPPFHKSHKQCLISYIKHSKYATTHHQQTRKFYGYKYFTRFKSQNISSRYGVIVCSVVNEFFDGIDTESTRDTGL